MKKSMFILFILPIFAFFFGFLAVTKAEAAEYTWKFAHEEPQDSFMDVCAHMFGDLLAKKSNGEIDIKVYPAGTLGTSQDMVELVQQNVIQFNIADAGHLGSIIPEAQVFLLHYTFPKDLKLVQQVLQPNTRAMKILGEKFREKNIEQLNGLTCGWQVWTSNKPLRKPEDFKGFKMRTMTSKLLLDAFRAYGANPTPTPFAELYSNLQLKMVDGQTNPLWGVYLMGFHQLQDYITFSYDTPFIEFLITNKAFLNSLPPSIGKMIREAALEVVDPMFEWQDNYDKGCLEKVLKDKPSITVIRLNQEEIDAFKNLAKPVRGVFIDMVGESGAEILEALDKDIEDAVKQKK